MEKEFSMLFRPVMGDADFLRISKFIHNECGIRLPMNKKVMVEARLLNRLRDLHILTYSEYISFVFDSGKIDPEVNNMIDVITTNKTDFFREAAHFQFFVNEALPEFVSNHPGKQFRLWSAGCSSGEEVYTLAMILNDFGLENSRFLFKILGTDISTRMLLAARTAIFAEGKASPIPSALKKRYLLRSKDRNKASVRIVRELREKVEFKYHNLISDALTNYDTFDAIFCRNVLIYFEKETQMKVIEKLTKVLRSGCYLFIGHSEAIMNHNLPLVQVGPSIYQKQ